MCFDCEQLHVQELKSNSVESQVISSVIASALSQNYGIFDDTRVSFLF